MHHFLKVPIVLCAFTFSLWAADNRGSVVITFKDGHKQSFPLSDVARILLKTPTKTTSVALPAEPFAASAGRFLGKWKVGDGQGNDFTINLEREGRATKSIGATHGTWVVENGEAHISWDDGWHDAIRKVDSGYEKVAYGPGKTFSDKPDNVTSAKSLEPI